LDSLSQHDIKPVMINLLSKCAGLKKVVCAVWFVVRVSVFTFTLSNFFDPNAMCVNILITQNMHGAQTVNNLII
jgi:hypothetical protein